MNNCIDNFISYGSIYVVLSSPPWEASVRKSKKKLPRKPTLIERVFDDIVKREMTEKERRVLLTKAKKTRKRN
jgi:hypothetical protein